MNSNSVVMKRCNGVCSVGKIHKMNRLSEVIVIIVILSNLFESTSCSRSSGSLKSSFFTANENARLITLSSGEYDNTEGGDGAKHDSESRRDNQEEGTSEDRGFNLAECARLLTSTMPSDAGVTGHRTLGGGGFGLKISGNPTKYVHGESYTGE